MLLVSGAEKEIVVLISFIRTLKEDERKSDKSVED